MPHERDRFSPFDLEVLERAEELVESLGRFVAAVSRRTAGHIPDLIVDASVPNGSALSPKAENLDASRTYYLVVVPYVRNVPPAVPQNLPAYKYTAVIDGDGYGAQSITGTTGPITMNFDIKAGITKATPVDVLLVDLNANPQIVASNLNIKVMPTS